MTAEEELRESLVKELETRGAQTRISQALEVSATTIMRWAAGETMPAAMQKLLRLYLFGEIPFALVRDPRDAEKLLDFTPGEWQLITILAARAGQTQKQWIRSQILAYLAFQGGNQTGSTAAPNPLYPPLAQVAEEGNEYRGASGAKPGDKSPKSNGGGAV